MKVPCTDEDVIHEISMHLSESGPGDSSRTAFERFVKTNSALIPDGAMSKLGFPFQTDDPHRPNFYDSGPNEVAKSIRNWSDVFLWCFSAYSNPVTMRLKYTKYVRDASEVGEDGSDTSLLATPRQIAEKMIHLADRIPSGNMITRITQDTVFKDFRTVLAKRFGKNFLDHLHESFTKRPVEDKHGEWGFQTFIDIAQSYYDTLRTAQCDTDNVIRHPTNPLRYSQYLC